MISTDMFEANRFINEKLNLPAKLSVSDEKLRQTLGAAAQAQQQQAPQGAPPSTTAGAVKFPEAPGVTI